VTLGTGAPLTSRCRTPIRQRHRNGLTPVDAVVDHAGRARARHAERPATGSATPCDPHGYGATDYVNTIPVTAEPAFPGDEDIERRIRSFVRWNAAMMVHRAQRTGLGVGGHISTFASTATLYEVEFNHFFRRHGADGGADQIYFQGHASPGIYARAFLEGRLSASRLDGFRQEISHAGKGGGLPSYPHPSPWTVQSTQTGRATC
jgi:pyruvate dehydrogenase E1 component